MQNLEQRIIQEVVRKIFFNKNFHSFFYYILEAVVLKENNISKNQIISGHQKSVTSPLDRSKNTQVNKKPFKIINSKGSPNTKGSSDKPTPKKKLTDKIAKCKKNSDDKITTHQKNHYSDLKKTIIIDDSGNNNLNIPRKKMNSNITKLNVLNRMIIDLNP